MFDHAAIIVANNNKRSTLPAVMSIPHFQICAVLDADDFHIFLRKDDDRP